MTDSVQELVAQYKEKIKKQLAVTTVTQAQEPELFSREYKQFRQESLPKRLTLYENLCGFSEKILKIKAKPDRIAELQEELSISHLEATPQGAIAFSLLFPIGFMILSVIVGTVFFGSLFFAFFGITLGLVLMTIFGKIPNYVANGWRMKASNQMVLSVFYVVTYMRHTSNLENAIGFAAEHLSPPLSLDFKRVLWELDSGVYETIKDALETYLETWRKWNPEFVESFHLIESSLYEGSEERRVAMLEKSLDVMLEGTYEKMLHFAQNLKSPITTLHMLGVILPILGLVILPLMVNFMGGVSWWQVALFYNILLPLIVFFMAKQILSRRPSGYGELEITEVNPELKKYENVILHLGGKEVTLSPLIFASSVGGVLFFMALLPLILHSLNPSFDITSETLKLSFLDYRQSTTSEQELGPYGIGATILSLFFPLSLALGFGIYYRLKTNKLVEIRKNAKALEAEFSTALFQLGNRLGDGLPAEIAFTKVAEISEDTVSGNFFKLVAANITKLGMGVKDAIFNPQTGALVQFPSKIIQSSMKVLIESVKKGPKIAAQAVLNVSRYIKEMHKVDERLKDLLADITSDVKSQIGFLTPAIAGIVIGITSMITYILGSLQGLIPTLEETEAGTMGQITSFFGDSIPTYYLQLIVGVYVFQIIYILTTIQNGIENGADKLQERHELGQNLVRSVMTYSVITFAVVLIFNIIAGRIVEVAVG